MAGVAGVGVDVAGGVEGTGVGAESPGGEGIGIGTGVCVHDIKTKAVITRAIGSNFSLCPSSSVTSV